MTRVHFALRVQLSVGFCSGANKGARIPHVVDGWSDGWSSHDKGSGLLQVRVWVEVTYLGFGLGLGLG